VLQAVPHLPGPHLAEVPHRPPLLPAAPAAADAIVYLIFSVIYWAATGENIYDALDWGNPSGAGKLSALILFVGLPFLWILLYCVFLGRRCHRVATSESGKLPV